MRLLRPAFVAVTVAALVPLAPSPAGAAEPAGSPCGYTAFVAPDGSGEVVAILDGGPVVLDSDPAGQPVWGSITCGLLLNGTSHSDTPAASASSEVTPGVAVLPSTPVRLTIEPEDDVVLCTRVDVVDGPTYYWTPPQTSTGAGSWSTDPNASCDGWRGGSDPIGPLLRPVEEAIDAVVCVPLAVLLPPEGDVPGIWDCPPYES